MEEELLIEIAIFNPYEDRTDEQLRGERDNPLVPHTDQKGDVVRSVNGELLVSTDLWNDTSHL
jgi:hypothetical protein